MSQSTINGKVLPKRLISKKINFEIAVLRGATALLIFSSTPAAKDEDVKRLDSVNKKAFNDLVVRANDI
jgi:hypothetical protein